MFGSTITTLSDNDIVAGQIKLKLSVIKAGTTEFKGSKVITVNLTT